MKAIKRTVAALLATLMLATSTSFTLAAENYSDKEAVVVAKVNAAGIMTGTDKGFEPSKSLTRAEAAAIIVRMKGISESAVKATAGTTLFNDVAASHWASGYVNQASNLGIVKGVSAKEFAPDREVTIAEFTTMAVRALGAGQLVDAEGTWPTNYVNFANEEGLLDEVNAIYTSVATRLQAATIVANSLEAEMWAKSTVKSNGELTWSKNGKTILEDVLEITALDDATGTYKAVKCTSVSTKDMLFNGKDVVDGVDLSNIKVGLTYDVWMNKDGDIIGLWETELNTITKVNFTEVVKVTTSNNKITLKVDGKDKEYKYVPSGDKATVVKVNNADKTIGTDVVKSNAIFGVAYVDDDTVTALYAEKYMAYGVIDEVKTKKVEMKSTDVKNATSPVSSISINEDDEYFVTRDGNGIDISDLKDGEAIAYYYISGTHKEWHIDVVSEKITGKVTSIGEDFIKLDKVKYDLVAGLAKPSTGDEIEAYLNNAGDIVMYEKVEEAAADVAIVKYIKKVPGDSYSSVSSKALTPAWNIKLFYTDGTVSDSLTVDFEETANELIDSYANYAAFLSGEATMLSSLGAANEYGDIVTAGSSKDDLTSGEKSTIGRYYVQNSVTLGSAVCYEVSGSKVTFVQKDGTEPEYTAFGNATTPAVGDTLKVGTKNVTIIDGTNSKTYYVTKDAKIFNIKAISGNTKEVNVEEVEFEDLDTTNKVAGFVGKVDEDEVDLVFFTNSTLARVAETNFAFVTSVIETEKYNNNAAYEVEVIMQDGSEDTLIWTKDECDVKTKPNADTFYDITVKDSLLVNYTVPSASKDKLLEDDATAEVYMTDYASHTSVITLNTAIGAVLTNTSYTLADDVLVLKVDNNNNYTVSSIDEINEYDASDLDDENAAIISLATYEDEDDTLVKLVVYHVVRTKEVASVLAEVEAVIGGDDAATKSFNVINVSFYAKQGTSETVTLAGYVFKVAEKATQDYKDYYYIVK